MKLRIRGNSIRLRVSQSELEQILRDGSVQDAVTFPTGRLVYQLRVTNDDSIVAMLEGETLRVCLSKSAVARWQAPEEVSLEAEQPLPDGQTLRILVEKDFACLVPRDGEEDRDAFPNPGKPAA